MQHLDEGTIHSWLDGALSADEAARVEAHLKECPECAAAVAEARGFIAASSRILTALDNAPRGVVPVTAPKKRVDPIVWRVAATLLVVAAGTLVVFRNGGREARIVTTNADTARSTMKAVELAPDEPIRTTTEPVPPVRIQENSTRGPAIGTLQSSAGSVEKSATKRSTADALTATDQTSPALAPRISYSAKAPAPASQTNIPLQENKAVAGEAGVATADKISVSSAYAQAAPPSPQLLSRERSAAALNAAGETAPLKIIGTPRQLGAKITLYEVAPGDTVTLTEAIPLALSEVVVTGATTTRQAGGRSAAAPSKARADAAAITSMADSQHVAGVPSSAPVVSARAPTSQLGMVNALHTITWTDPATGNALALTGRMPEAQLQQIRIRIERERAAAAAKKKP